MSTSKLALTTAFSILMFAQASYAEDCGPREIGGKKYTCCKKSVTNTGKLECDGKAKQGETMKCGTKVETTYECSEVTDKKKS